MTFTNFLIIKMLVKVKYANVINIAANEEVIPELLQSNCNSKNIYKVVCELLDAPEKLQEQVNKTQIILSKLKSDKSSSELASKALNNRL